jgi:NADP-dependent aldehyde dehydrogenase
MAELQGTSLIGGAPTARGARTFQAVDPVTGQPLAPHFHAATDADVARACELATEAAEAYGRTPSNVRAAFLRAIADGLTAAGETIIARAHAESALPLPRLQGELGRTCAQLRLFADVLDEGSWVDARIDTADPSRTPPKPDVRSLRRPLGPVAVFGASNFPLAFSTAGGDTASALAAGNPVIVKAHPAHPGTSELVAQVIAEAIVRLVLPPGTFALLFDDGITVGQALVRHPAIRAVGFTGSRRGGEALMRLAAQRPDPIPVYAEMGSVNPVILFPSALHERAAAIAEGLHASFTLGVGQFCTNPGVVLVPAGADGDAFAGLLAERTRRTAAGAMLTPGISAAYQEGQTSLGAHGAERLAGGDAGSASIAACGEAALWQVPASRALAEPHLLDEVFGPSTLLVRYDGFGELEQFVQALEGQLTATVHAQPEELREHTALLGQLAGKAGRLVANQFPTGVEVNHAMIHGGPFPATSDGRSTSVGTHAIERFSRYVAYQNWPDDTLPEELRASNPRGIWRLVNGERTRD